MRLDKRHSSFNEDKHSRDEKYTARVTDNNLHVYACACINSTLRSMAYPYETAVEN